MATKSAPTVEPCPPDGTALTARLPGETTIDGDLLTDAVNDINAIYVAKGLELARVLGNYVLDTFFEGTLENFHARGSEHVTFRALADREDLHVAYNTIWYAVAVLDQLRQLPEDIGEALPMAHHKLLLPVRDQDLKLQLAQRALDDRLSSRQLAQVIRDARSGNRTGRVGRPPLPAFVKGLTRLRHAVEMATSEDIDDDTIAAMDAAERQALAEEYDQHIARLKAIRDRIGG